MADNLSPREDAWRSWFHSFERPSERSRDVDPQRPRAAKVQESRPLSFFRPADQLDSILAILAVQQCLAQLYHHRGRSPGQTTLLMTGSR
jgi:hypothetical protein